MSIDLAMKGYGELPSMPEKDEEHYPEFHYCGDKELDLPDEGTMEIHFRKVSEEERTGRDGKTRYSCTIEVRKIEEVEGEDEVEAPASTAGAKNTEQALDKILKTMEKMVAKDDKVHSMMDKGPVYTTEGTGGEEAED